MAEIKRNCWTCGHNRAIGDTFTCDSDHVDVWRWQDDAPLDDALMPAKDAPACPGWKPKPGEDAPEAVPAVAGMSDSALNLLDRVAALERAVHRLEFGGEYNPGD